MQHKCNLEDAPNPNTTCVIIPAQEVAERKIAVMQSVLAASARALAVPGSGPKLHFDLFWRSCVPKISSPAPDPGTVFLRLHRSPALYQAYPGTGFGFWERSLAGTL